MGIAGSAWPDVSVRHAQAEDTPEIHRLLVEAGLSPHVVVDETFVAVQCDRVIACARLRRLGDGNSEVAGVAVRADARGSGVGRRLVDQVLAAAPGPVYALAVAPAFFLRLGFAQVADLPAMLQARAEGECASSRPVGMRWDPLRP